MLEYLIGAIFIFFVIIVLIRSLLVSEITLFVLLCVFYYLKYECTFYTVMLSLCYRYVISILTQMRFRLLRKCQFIVADFCQRSCNIKRLNVGYDQYIAEGAQYVAYPLYCFGGNII